MIAILFFIIIGFVQDGKLYRMGNEDFDANEDSADVIPVTFDELEDFFTRL